MPRLDFKLFCDWEGRKEKGVRCGGTYVQPAAASRVDRSSPPPPAPADSGTTSTHAELVGEIFQANPTLF